MSTLNITINGRDYQIACDDGQEAHLGKLAQSINERMQLVTKHMGRVPENLHFVLTLLMVSDELHDAKKEARRARASSAENGQDGISEAQLAQYEEELSEQMEQFVARLESLAQKVSAA